MRGVRLLVSALAAVLLALAIPSAAAALDAQQLRSRLAAEMGAAGGGSGAYARDLDEDRDLVAVRAGTARIPASVEKLFVTTATLLRYGPSGVLETTAVAAGDVDDGVLRGNLVLVGGGDPYLSDEGLRRLAREVRAAGVREVTGRVVGDETAFDRLRGSPSTGGARDPWLGGRLGALIMARGYQSDPALYVAQRFHAAARTAGISVRRSPRRGNAPTDADGLATLTSAPLVDIVRATLVPSDNFLAEMLLKTLGAEFGGRGTSSAGAAVVRSTLEPLGVTPRVVDGSGLSRSNRTTPREVVGLFDRMRDEPVGAVWRASMAVPGRSGTVASRMRGTAARRCSVKTGTLNGVSNLAGVCRTPGGDVGFAWLMSGIDVGSAHRIQDRMTATVARYTG